MMYDVCREREGQREIRETETERDTHKRERKKRETGREICRETETERDTHKKEREGQRESQKIQ